MKLKGLNPVRRDSTVHEILWLPYWRFFLSLELEPEAKDMFREYLKAKYDDIERFFSEWEMTFTSDGPFETPEERSNITEKMTKPDDFMVSVECHQYNLVFMVFNL